MKLLIIYLFINIPFTLYSYSGKLYSISLNTIIIFSSIFITLSTIIFFLINRKLKKRLINSTKNFEESQTLYKNIVEQIPGVVFQFVYWDKKNYKFINVSPKSKEIFGVDNDENFFHENMLKAIDPKDKQKFLKSLKEAVKKRVNWEFEGRIINKDKGKMWFLGKGELVDDKDGLRYNGIFFDITDQKNIEEALKISEQKLKRAQKIAKIGSWEWDKDKNQFNYSDQYFEMLGIEKNSYNTESFIKKIHPDDIEKVKMLTNISQNMGIGESVDFRIFISKNKTIWLRAIGEYIYDDVGQLKKIVGTHQDITDLMEAVYENRQTKQNFQSIFEQATVGIAILGLKGRWLKVNPTIELITGFKKRYLINTLFFDTIKTEYKELIKQDFHELISRKKEKIYSEIKLVRIDGGSLWVSTHIKLVNSSFGEPDHFIVIINDISERKRNEEILKHKEENLRITLQSIGDGVVVTDKFGKITRINPIAEKIIDITYKNSIGKDISDIIKIVLKRGEKPVENLYNFIINSKKIPLFIHHALVLSNSNMYYHISLNGAPLKSDKGEILGVVLVFRDITQQYILEEELKHSQKMESIGQLAGGIAHDFNNMLGGIIGATELISFDQKDKQNIEYLDLIERTAKRAADLTNKLLIFSRKGTTDMKVLDFHKVIKDALSILKRSIDKKIELVQNLNAESFKIEGDETLLQNAILNIGINARDAMPDGGKFEVKTFNKKFSKKDIEIRSIELKPGDYIVIQLKDEGTGIPKKFLKRIFEPFFTTKKIGSGTGLGLSAVYGTVTKHNGTISIDTGESKGTIFTILLPITYKIGDEKIASITDIKRGKGTVLIVDDEKIIRKTASKMLEKMGYEVFTAEDGVIGLEIYKKNRVDLIILDLMMPKMGGDECFYKLKEIDKDIKVIISSGFTSNRSISKLIEDGVKDFIQKPYTIKNLSQKVSSALEKK